VQAALKTVIEPIFEADMLECSFGFRRGRSTHDALQALIDEGLGRQAMDRRDGYRQLF
jgi:RNA-directed DNA polymerase